MANKFGTKKGSYVINDIPTVGEYEYIYTNSKILCKVDQFGINTIQYIPPVDVALIKRGQEGKLSPWRVYFSYKGKVYNNFDFLFAKKHTIEFDTDSASYSYVFGNLKVNTKLMISENEPYVIMRTTFTNSSNKQLDFEVMPFILPYVNDLMMAPWDKPEWYTRTIAKHGDKLSFNTTRYSTKGDVTERRYTVTVFDGDESKISLSSEKTFADTLNFTNLKTLTNLDDKVEGLYAFPQSYTALYNVSLKAKESKTFTQVMCITKEQDKIDEITQKCYTYFDEKNIEIEKKNINSFYNKMFTKNSIETDNKDFNSFINSFLPLELHWVSKLDRGWPTGMRGTRDASNDFMGMLSYDIKECREIALHLLSCQRSDGWYPRQVPMAKGGKFDLRPFVDGGCFATEFIYNYLCYSHDKTFLKEKLGYYDSDKVDTAFNHIKNGIDYYLKEENVGEHGIVKINGGDWLDTLSAAGLKGKGETVMVTCQLVMCLEYLVKIAKWSNYQIDSNYYLNRAEKFREDVNKYSLNKKGFFDGVYTDNGEWLFSSCDPDGECRPYTPTNAYAVVSGVAKNPKLVIDNLKTLKSSQGYRLFYPAMGKKKIDLIGKMGTGDLQPGFGENGNPYNHGSHGFFLRALAKVGDYETFYDVLNFMLPFNEKYHNSLDSMSAPYAIVNVYQSVPMFNGRAGFSFLTGSVAMIYRAIYHWMAGVEFTFDGITISPCIPKEFNDIKVKLKLKNGKNLSIKFNGFGNQIKSANVGKVENGKLYITNEELSNGLTLNIEMK